MKSIFLTLIILSALNSTAQSPIIPFNSDNIPENAYCKDLNNDLEKFTGTWKYINGNTELTITIIKNEEVYLDSYYTDELAGNYQYIENGIEIVNTMNNSNGKYSFSGSEMSNDTNSFTIAYFHDPGKPRAGYKLKLEYLGTSANGDIQMDWKLMQSSFYSGYVPGETQPTASELDQTMRLPSKLILIKE